jgi:hypothetical protein
MAYDNVAPCGKSTRVLTASAIGAAKFSPTFAASRGRQPAGEGQQVKCTSPRWSTNTAERTCDQVPSNQAILPGLPS